LRKFENKGFRNALHVARMSLATDQVATGTD